MESTSERLDAIVQDLGALLSQVEVARDCEARAERYRTAAAQAIEKESLANYDLFLEITGKDLLVRDLRKGLRFYRFLFWTLGIVNLVLLAGMLYLTKLGGAL